MHKLTRALFVAAVLAGVPLAAEDAADIIRRSVSQERPYFERARDFNYEETTHVRELDKAGKVRKTTSEVFDVGIYYGRPYRKLIARDGKPLSAKQQAEEQAKMDRELAKRKRKAEDDGVEKQTRKEEIAAFREIPRAFDFRLIGEETRYGRKMWMIDATPRAGYKPVNDRAKLLPKMRGRLWVDQADYQLARVEAETIDTLSFGLFFVRVGKGSRITLEQTRVNGEIWLPLNVQVKGDARLALLKTFRAQVDVAYRNYRKFQTESRIVSTEIP